jgi:hypothetical protein
LVKFFITDATLEAVQLISQMAHELENEIQHLRCSYRRGRNQNRK